MGFFLFVLPALGTFLLEDVESFAQGRVAAGLIGFAMGGEGDITPYLLSRYFGLRSFSTLHGFPGQLMRWLGRRDQSSWTAHSILRVHTAGCCLQLMMMTGVAGALVL